MHARLQASFAGPTPVEEEHCRLHSAQKMVQASQRPHLFGLAHYGREGECCGDQ